MHRLLSNPEGVPGADEKILLMKIIHRPDVIPEKLRKSAQGQCRGIEYILRLACANLTESKLLIEIHRRDGQRILSCAEEAKDLICIAATATLAEDIEDIHFNCGQAVNRLAAMSSASPVEFWNSSTRRFFGKMVNRILLDLESVIIDYSGGSMEEGSGTTVHYRYSGAQRSEVLIHLFPQQAGDSRGQGHRLRSLPG